MLTKMQGVCSRPCKAARYAREVVRHQCSKHSAFKNASYVINRVRHITCTATAPVSTSVSHDTLGDTDTIAAIVTGGTSGSVAIIRISGQAATAVAQSMFQPGRHSADSTRQWAPRPHQIHYGHILDPAGDLVDEILLLFMPGPRSYTTEDVVELHCHGGPVTAQRVLERCLQAGCRLARNGEFTMRAFLNGRLDLSQAESVMSLVNARTAKAADSALAGLKGGIGSEVAELRKAVVDLLAEMEARLDFDEELPSLDFEAITTQISELQLQIERALHTARKGRLYQTGLQVALVGRPNVGKSSLLNALSCSERSIVTDIAGTTRDVVDMAVEIRGIPCTLLDTAGIREQGCADVVEQIGMERSTDAASTADIVIAIYDAEDGWTEKDSQIYWSLWGPDRNSCKVQAPSILVANKEDTVESINFGALPKYCHDRFDAMVAVSATESKNLKELEDTIESIALGSEVAEGGMAWAVNSRQAQALVKAHESLMKTTESIKSDLPIDFWTIDMRDALYALGEVTGDAVTEEVLDVVFSKFCIGK